jgi:hypothetical protein
MTNACKKMEVGRVYETLAQMTPEERLSFLQKDREAIQKLILKNSTSTKDELKKSLFKFIEEYIEDQKEYYEDFTYPEEAMLEDIHQIACEMTGEEEFMEIVKKYVRSLI